MPCCSVSRSRISFCLPCHVRDSRSIWFIFISASSHPDCRARTATGPRDARRPRPPRRTATGHTTGQRAPPVGAAPSPRPRAKPRADSRARMARTKRARPDAWPTRTPRIRSKARRRCARCVRRRARRHRSPRTRPRMPRRPHRRHATGPRPDRDFRPVSETHVGDNAHTDTAHASVHTPHPTRADRAAHLRCTTARRIDTHSIDTQHSALNVSAATGAHDNHLAVLARFNRPTACSTHRHRIGASGHNAHLGHSLCSHGSRLERWWLFSPLSSPTHGSD